ncbi:hypothetical protein KAV67_00235 [Candidatus Bipolaricaulota bacterium]|nr:hypothetical protein [Candidatus Bipolaricaulota bacterium]
MIYILLMPRSYASRFSVYWSDEALADNLRERVMLLAKKQGKSLSSVALQAVKEYVEREEKKASTHNSRPR